MRFSLPRESYLPRESNGSKNIEVITDGEATVYTYTTVRGTLSAMGFHGSKQAAPDFHFSYANEAQRAKKIADFFAGIKAHAEYKVKAKAERLAPRKEGQDMTTAQRNATIKKVLVKAFAPHKVRVVGSTGTAYGWVTVKIAYVPRTNEEGRTLRAHVMSLIEAAGCEIGTYGYDDPGSDYGYGKKINISFNDAFHYQEPTG